MQRSRLFVVLAGTVMAALPGPIAAAVSGQPTTGTFSGTVTGTGAPAGIENVSIDVFDAGGVWVAGAGTNSNGVYTTPELAPGDYYATTFAPPPFINELFDDSPCFFCDVTAGTPITVTAGNDTSGIDFDLAAGGFFSGTITATGSGDELAGIIVDIYDSAGVWLANPTTDSQGDYRSPGLPAGDYHASTWNTDGFINEVFDDQPCPPSCDPVQDGTIIQVQAATETTGIDFVLSPGGIITGTVTDRDSGLPVEDMVVEIWDSEGEFATAQQSDSSGRYSTTGLQTGTYYAITWNDLGYPQALYDDFECAPCTVTLGTPVPVMTGSTTPSIDFQLAKGGFVSGEVTDAGSGHGIADVHVEIWNTSGQLVSWESSGAAGSYKTTWVVPEGRYYVKTWNDLGFVNEIYPNQPCAACDATHGSWIDIDSGATTSDIDFGLARGGSISGTLTLADPSDALLTNIQVFDENGQWVWSQAPPTTSGNYTVAVGLPTGTYYVRTAGGRPWVNEVWDNQQCLYGCDVVADGQAIQVHAPATTGNIDFTLDPGVKLTGTVKDASTQEGIDDSIAEIFNPAGERVSGCRVGSAGGFTCWQAIPAGTYYAATSNYAGYIDEIFSTPRQTCVGGSRFCDVTRGTPISVNLTSTPNPVHFTLNRGGWFEGSVIDEERRLGLAGTGLRVYDSGGDMVTEINWKQPLRLVPDGSYRSCGLPAGDYYTVTDTSTLESRYADELFEDIPCIQGCRPIAGTAIGVAGGSGTSGIDFELAAKVFGDGFESHDISGWAWSQ